MRTRFRTSRLLGMALACTAIAAAGTPCFGWSLLEEVTLVQPGLTAELVWELIDTKVYCESGPPGLDRLACAVAPDPGEFWIGLDAAGNRYGTINGSNTTGVYFDIYRRPAGSRFDQHLVRITKRVEPTFGQVTKLFAANAWQVDATNGTMLIGLLGSCFSTACVAQGDTTDHMALIRISGLPTLFDLQLTYVPSGAIAFNVPARPEGLAGADRFDVYHGDAASLPDLSLARSLACDVAPGALPGMIVQVTDTLPDPAAGRLRYYLVTVTDDAARRAGRRWTGPAPTGRPASLLPDCPSGPALAER